MGHAVVDVFLSVTGDYPNIGDAYIRRLAVNWMRTEDPALFYARDAPNEWLEQVGARESDLVLRSGRARWLRAIVASQSPIVVFEPGEIRFDLRALPRELAFMLMAIVVRRRRGVVFLPPRAAVGRNRLTVAVHRQLCRLSNVAQWRDIASLRLVGAGELMPDIGFSGDLHFEKATEKRDLVLVSLRGHRAFPSNEWISAVASWAETNGWAIRTLAQVKGDEDRNRQLAQALRADYIEWTGSDTNHEERLRALYRSARAVISDRLHVLIMASLGGAIPVELVAKPQRKVATHFAEIGLHRVSADADTFTVAEMVSFLNQSSTVERGEEMRRSVLAAQTQLLLVREQLLRDVASSRQPRVHRP